MTVRSIRLTRQGQRRSFRPFRFLLRSFMFALVVLIAWTLFVQSRMIWLPDRPLAPRDAGIVLGAALWQDEPSPALRERLDRAAELYESGAIRKIVVSGGYDYAGARLTEAEGMRNYLMDRGVPENDILLENDATNTYENMLYSRGIMEKSGLSTAVIITHRYHAVRALDIAGFLGFEEPAASPVDSQVLSMFWHRGRETLALAKWQWDKVRLSIGQPPAALPDW